MKLSAATNWDLQLLDNLARFPEVAAVYGKMESDLVGGGRPSYLLPKVTRQAVQEYVAETHKRGMEFIYLMNPQCLDNLEYTAPFNRQLEEELCWLEEAGVDYITVSIPYLLQMVKKRHPRIKINVSVFANVNSVQRALFFQDLGADIITLPEYVNRDFKLLEQIKNRASAAVQLIANMTCLYGCPFQLYHANLVSHASQAGHRSGGFCPDYCIMNCTRIKISRPEEIIKSRWIRPEDTAYYEEAGIDSFKIIERFDTTETLTRTVHAYVRRRYDGNLADILNIKTDSRKQLPVDIDYFLQPGWADIHRLQDMEETLYLGDQYIDNNALEGFLEFFRTKDCYSSDCAECGYCRRAAEKAVKIPTAGTENMLCRLEDKLEALVSGEFFKATGTGTGNSGRDMAWDEQVRGIFDRIIDAVPAEFREISKKVVSRKAEALAAARQAEKVCEQDMVRAFLSETPRAFQAEMVQDLRRLVENVEKYLD